MEENINETVRLIKRERNGEDLSTVFIKLPMKEETIRGDKE